MSRRLELTGMIIGKWTVLSECERRRGQTHWVCRCECGTEAVVAGSELNHGRSRQCRGCRTRTHGASRRKDKKSTPEYGAWCGMIGRCESPKNQRFKNYGGRGISVCERWRHSFQNFLEDMGKRPSLTHSLDRIDVNGNYEPGNCRWATATQQARNKRNNRVLAAFGKTMTITEWAEQTGIPPYTIRRRIRRGWTTEMALSVR